MRLSENFSNIIFDLHLIYDLLMGKGSGNRVIFEMEKNVIFKYRLYLF